MLVRFYPFASCEALLYRKGIPKFIAFCLFLGPETWWFFNIQNRLLHDFNVAETQTWHASSHVKNIPHMTNEWLWLLKCWCFYWHTEGISACRVFQLWLWQIFDTKSIGINCQLIFTCTRQVIWHDLAPKSAYVSWHTTCFARVVEVSINVLLCDFRLFKSHASVAMRPSNKCSYQYGTFITWGQRHACLNQEDTPISYEMPVVMSM